MIIFIAYILENANFTKYNYSTQLGNFLLRLLGAMGHGEVASRTGEYICIFEVKMYILERVAALYFNFCVCSDYSFCYIFIPYSSTHSSFITTIFERHVYFS